MPVTSTLGSHTYLYNGSVASLSLGSLLDLSLVNLGQPAGTVSFRAEDGILNAADSGASLVSIAGGAPSSFTYIGAGWAATAFLLGAPILPVTAMAFSVKGQIYVHFPNGPPVLSGLSIAFKLNGNTGFTLPNPNVVCFTNGTRILTPRGAVPVEALRCGDLVETLDRGAQRLLWIGRRPVTLAEQCLSPELRAIRIPKGAFGTGLPQRGLKLSPQHRILLAQTPEAPPRLVAAKHLVGRALVEGAGITRAAPRALVYFHLLFAHHEIIWAEGLAVESLHLGPMARRTLGDLLPPALSQALTEAPAQGLARPELRTAALSLWGKQPLHGFGPRLTARVE